MLKARPSCVKLNLHEWKRLRGLTVRVLFNQSNKQTNRVNLANSQEYHRLRGEYPRLRDCMGSSDILAPRGSKVSVIYVTAKTMHERLLLVPVCPSNALFVIMPSASTPPPFYSADDSRNTQSYWPTFENPHFSQTCGKSHESLYPLSISRISRREGVFDANVLSFFLLFV